MHVEVAIAVAFVLGVAATAAGLIAISYMFWPAPPRERPAQWRCRALSASTGPDFPQDCDWPMCGCDPYANKVITALEESGALRPDH